MEIRRFRVVLDNFSYLIISNMGKGVLIDPGTNASEAMKFIGHNNLELICIINTHHHADHISDNERIKSLYSCPIICSEEESDRIPDADRTVSDGEALEFDDVRLQFILTPGHTPGSICIMANGQALFTGDTLFIGDCGRTDLKGGDSRQMFQTMQRLKSLPDELVVYPGHDYGNTETDTLGNQKRTNKTLSAESFEEFSLIP